jgi:tetratricopeptide (TPR) repeat protein
VPAAVSLAHLAEAEALLQKGDAVAALAILGSPIDDGAPWARRARMTQARVLARLGRADEALAALEPLVTEGTDASALALRGVIRQNRGDPAALADFKAALQIDGDLPEAWLGRLELSIDAHEGARTDDVVRRAIAALQARAHAPTLDVQLLHDRARLAQYRGYPEEAAKLRSEADGLRSGPR